MNSKWILELKLNEFFENAVSTLNITENSFITTRISDGITDPSLHSPSILWYKSIWKSATYFPFKTVEMGDIEKKINNIKKATTDDRISFEILKKSSKVSASVLHKLFSDSTEKSGFPQNLKLVDITQIYKNNDPSDKTNYRPIFIISFLSPYLCWCRKGFNTQHTLLTLVDKWRKSLDNKGFGGAILMDLSKVFDTLYHDLLITKLHAYGFQHFALKLLHSYLSKRWHRTKLNTSFSSWEELIEGVPQGSALVSVSFNLYLNDLFYLADCTEVCNFADGTTFHACDID